MKKALKETALTFLPTIVCLSILFLLAILFEKGEHEMSTGVTITAIICFTILVMALFGKREEK